MQALLAEVGDPVALRREMGDGDACQQAKDHARSRHGASLLREGAPDDGG